MTLEALARVWHVADCGVESGSAPYMKILARFALEVLNLRREKIRNTPMDRELPDWVRDIETCAERAMKR